MERTWRLILDRKHSAAGNMAIDEAILVSCAGYESPPTLRLYGWARPSVSLGYFQQIGRGGLNLDYCRARGIAVVRRPTGGRAVLHGHDLTFSIALPEDQLPDDTRDIQESHAWLMAGILAGIRRLGLDAELGELDPLGRQDNAVDCFAHIAKCDIRSGYRKLVGSAQVRRYGGVLEQGSIPCEAQSVDVERLFGSESPAVALGISPKLVQSAVVRGFSEALGIELVPGKLTEYEISAAMELERLKYSSTTWTYERIGDATVRQP